MIALIVLVIFILVFLLIKRFLDRYGKYIPSSLLVMFIKQVRDIEESGNGRVVYKKVGDYDVIILIRDGKAIEAISMDMVNDKIYSGVLRIINQVMVICWFRLEFHFILWVMTS